MPRAWLAHDMQYAPAEQIPDILEAEHFDPASTVVLQGDPAGMSRPSIGTFIAGPMT